MANRMGLSLVATVLLLTLEGAAQNNKPLIDAVTVRYPETTQSLDHKFFANSTFRIVSAGKAETGIRLTGGQGVSEETDRSSTEVGLRGVYALDSQHAAADFLVTHTGGSSSNDDYLQVFQLEGGHPVLLYQLRFDSDLAGSGTSYDSQTRILTVRQTHIDPDKCIRCSGKLDVIHLEWVGDKFVVRDQQIEAAPKS
jgi:hypothetical protein